MAKTAKSPEDLDGYAAQLEGFAKTLRTVAGEMRSVGMKFHLCHGDTVLNVHFPAIELWAGQIALDLKPALRAFEKGVKSRTEVQQTYVQKRKAKAPRK